MSGLVNLVKRLVAAEPARFAAYGGTLALAAASWIAKALGVELPAEVVTGIQAIGIFVVTEVIRKVVTAPANLPKT